MRELIDTDSQPLAPSSLDSLLAPFSTHDFFANYWNKKLLYLPPQSNRYAGLSSWTQINQIVTSQQLIPLFFRVVKNGIRIAQEQYVDFSKPEIPRIRAENLLHYLSEGAMLTLNHIEATHKPISHLAQALERTFNSPVVGVYCANFRSDRGFNLHWDDREVFVLQIEGRKHWKVYRPTSDYPYWNSVTSTAYPTSDPVFDAILETGSLLYMPRGWWHVAHPLDEPSLHLSLVVKTPTGVDLSEWLGRQMKKYVSGRRDIPHIRQEDERADFIRDLRADFDRLWNDGLIEEFLKSYQATSLPHPTISLPNLTSPSNNDEL